MAAIYTELLNKSHFKFLRLIVTKHRPHFIEHRNIQKVQTG